MATELGRSVQPRIRNRALKCAVDHRLTDARSAHNQGSVPAIRPVGFEFYHSEVQAALASSSTCAYHARSVGFENHSWDVCAGKHRLRGGHMGAILFGSILLIAGIVGVLTARRSLEKGTARINSLGPNSNHRTALRVGSTIRWIFVVICLMVGIGMILAGALGALK